jgi:hypothetical protein
MSHFGLRTGRVTQALRLRHPWKSSDQSTRRCGVLFRRARSRAAVALIAIGVLSSLSFALALPAGATTASVLTWGSNSFACAAGAGGNAYCWGQNQLGALGNGTTTASTTPVEVEGVGGSGFLSGVVSLGAASYSICAATSDGSAYCWGQGAAGTLGDGATTDSSTPVQVVGVGGVGDLSNVKQVVGTAGASECALTTGGNVYCWGSDSNGQLGNNASGGQSDTPVEVVGSSGSGFLSGVTSLSPSEGSAVCAVVAAGNGYCWGNNYQGQFGDGSSSVPTVQVPTEIEGPGGTGYLSNIAKLSMGYVSACAVTTAGAAYCWGQNPDGELGNGTTTDSTTPVAVNGLSSGVANISVGGGMACATMTSDGAYCWGAGVIGNNAQTSSTVPTAVYDPTGAGPWGAVSNIWVARSTSGLTSACAISTSAALYCWGLHGEVGFAASSNVELPTEIGTFTGQATSATTLATSANPAIAGQSLALTATVTGSSPTGTVTFLDGTTTIGTAAVSTLGVATLSTSTLSVGTHSITATYGGDTNNVGSSSSAVSEVVETTPGPPIGVTAVASNGSATVSWSAPSSNGGAPITAYTVVASGSGGQTCVWSSGPLHCVVSGLTNGTSYTFTVTATNVAGTGAGSTTSLPVLPETVPGPPGSVVAVASDGSASVSWTAPTSDGGAAITSYTVSSSGGASCVWSTGPLNCVISGLTNGTSYTFTVVAANVVGNGAASSASAPVTPQATSTVPVLTPTVPGPPIGLAATPHTDSVDLTWDQPLLSGSASITGYEVFEGTSPAGEGATPIASVPFTTTSTTIGSLHPGTTYYFVVRALSSVGTSIGSNEVAAKIPQTPATSVDDTPAVPGGSVVGGITPPSTPSSATTLALRGPSSITLGNGTALVADVSPSSATGTVSFAEDGAPIPGCAEVPVVSGTAACSETERALGSHQLSAGFTGTSGFADSQSSPISLDVTAPSPARLDLDFGFGAGEPAAGGTVTVHGAGLQPGSTAVVSMHSLPVVIGTATVGADGSFVDTFALPTSVPAGLHHLAIVGKDPLGNTLNQEWWFQVGSNGKTVHLDPSPTPKAPQWTAPKSARPTLGTKGGTVRGTVSINGVSYAAYSPVTHAKSSVDSEVTAFTLLGTLGGLGAAGGIAAAAGGAREIEREREDEPSRQGSEGAHGHSGGGSLASAKVKHVKFRHEAEHRGDRSATWLSPFVDRIDALSLSLPTRINRLSPLGARLVNDGAYLRAMFGTFALLLPLGGIALGAWGAQTAHGAAVPPSFAALLSIVVVSSFDTFAGFLAALTFSIVIIASGNLDSAGALRTLLGVDILFFAAALAGSAARPLRRVPAKDAPSWFDRLADVAIAALIAMWALDKMVGAVQGISGVAFPIAKDAGALAIGVGGAMLARYLLETLGAHFYPQRLALVAPAKIGYPSPRQQITSAVVKTAIFVFFAIAYLGNVWELWVGAALFLVPSIVATFQFRLPNLPRLVRFMPSGVTKIVLMLIVGKLFATFVHHEVSSPATFISVGFVVLGLPSLALGALGFFARDGETFPLNWWWRFSGVGVVSLGVLLVEGVVRIG